MKKTSPKASEHRRRQQQQPQPPAAAVYGSGDYILVAPIPNSVRFILGRVLSVHHDDTHSLLNTTAESSGSARRSSHDDPSSGGLRYEMAPRLTCHTIASKKNAGKLLARAQRFNASLDHPRSHADNAALTKGDIDELRERRSQLQMDVDTSEARVAEIDLYMETVALSKAGQLERAEEAVAAANREVLLAKAALREAKADDWKHLMQCYRARKGDSSKVLLAVVEALLALTGATATADGKDIERRVMAANASTAAAANRRGIAKADACLRGYPSRSVPAEQVLLTKLYGWMQGIVKASQAQQAREELYRRAGGGLKTAVPTKGLTEKRKKRKSGSLREGSLSQSVSDGKEATDAESARLGAERAEHLEYLAIAATELAAMDELIRESEAALQGEGAVLYVPAHQVVGAVASSGDLKAALEASADVSPGEPVNLTAALGAQLVDLMTRHRAHTRSPSWAGRGSSSPSDARPPERTGSSSARRTAGASSPSPPRIPPLPLTELKIRRSSSGFSPNTSYHDATHHSSRDRATPRSSGSRDDDAEHDLRHRLEKLNSTPRLPTPRFGPPLLDDSSASLLHRSVHLRDGSGDGGGDDSLERCNGSTPSHAKGSPRGSTAAVSASVAAQERHRYEQRVSELERRLERALQANPKESELQLLRDELKGTKRELGRITEERNSLLRERRERSQFSALNRRAAPRPGATAPSASSSGEEEDGEEEEGISKGRRLGSGRLGDQLIIDDLEEQLNAAHRRIRELESGLNGGSGSGSGSPLVTADPAAVVGLSASAGDGAFLSPLGPPSPPPPGSSAVLMTAGSDGGVRRGAVGTTDGGDAPLSLSPSDTVGGPPPPEGGPRSLTPSPELTAAHQRIQSVLSQLAQEQQVRQQLQVKVEALQRDHDTTRKSAKELEERLNLALHAREDSQAQAHQQRQELDVMWARLEEAEAELHEYRELESIARLQQRDATEDSVARSGGGGAAMNGATTLARGTGGGASLVSAVNGNAELSSEPPSVCLSAAGHLHDFTNPSHAAATSEGHPATADADESRAPSPTFGAARDASQSPQPYPRSISGGGNHNRAVSVQPVENMSAAELRREVCVLREAVEALQSSEIRLATELNSLRERQREERRRRQQARTVRLQMLNRLQEAVQQTMDADAKMATVPEVLERSKEEAEAIMALRRMSR